MTNEYDIGVRNVLRALGSPHSRVFFEKSDLADVERAKAAKLCEEVSLSAHAGIPHIIEKSGQHTWGRYTHRTGLRLTEKGKEALKALVDDWKRT